LVWRPQAVIKNSPAVGRLSVGLPPDQLLYIIKWLFIEQDLTYWNQTGRDMLMRAIEQDVFGIQ
jgi:hypothetical protein